ncbi:MAG: hypothetical protein ACOC1U_10315 [Spirochaetota bacterium]
MIDGIAIAIVGMLAVFAFLTVLVLSMTLLRVLVSRFPAGAHGAASTGGIDEEAAAALIAAVHDHELRRGERA